MSDKMIRYVVLGILALALIASIVVGVRGCKQDERDENNQMVNSGQMIEREAGQREVINAVKNANEARDNPTSNELNVVCNKYDRNC
jgi:Na+-transporting NADH:ubiquinone oxidoreductase subunit NqrC